MAFYTIEKTKIRSFLNRLLTEFTLIAPLKKDNRTSFEEVVNSGEVVLTSRNTDKSPKGSFFPQTEVMFSYKEGKIHKPEMKGRRLLFGIRPCDAKGFVLLDKVFAGGDFEDVYYKEKREGALIFGMACNEPQTTCFCTSFHTGPYDKENVDVFWVDIGEGFLLESITERGEAVLEKQGLSKASSEDIRKVDELKKAAESEISDRLDVSGLKEGLSGLFDNPIWEEIYLRCVGCGICTFFCPTCHCFDIVDEGDRQSGKRIRIWDSCMFPLFTLHASGHQPRETGKERFRQRIMHKFNYFPEKFGEAACVGCGRCVVNCPVNLDIREVVTVQPLIDTD
ncbi:MAG: 4Fe-4S dicluster domain-containing protein [bacterium]